MPKSMKCPPQTLCINKTLLTTVTISVIIGALFYQVISKKVPFYAGKYMRANTNINKTTNQFTQQNKKEENPHHFIFQVENQSLDDTYHNIYKPPEKENPYVSQEMTTRLNINIPTSHRPSEYRQVGILTRTNPNDQDRERETILALFGRPLHKSSKWQYYTMTDKSQGIKLPITYKKKTCNSTYGCEELYSDDVVHVQGYNESFKVTIYETESLEYF